MTPIAPINAAHINSVLDQIRTSSRNLLGGDVPKTTRADFSSLLENTISKVNSMQQEADAMKTSYELGDSDLDLPSVMVSMQKASLAFEAMTQVRNKCLTAYQEIMNMPV
ncbi:MAG TPA: flagellar hook-basal body complex protein FliE [Candidatus Acidoferrum sp.]|nr:flagellar hook-basal body complex protein FliE [Candidatus Acidoferrum sp.]